MLSDAEASTKQTFAGYPSGARATPVPSLFFSELLPQIKDDAELRVTIYAFYALSRRKGYPRFVTLNELRAEAPLLASLEREGDDGPLGRLEAGLESAVKRGSLLALDLDCDGSAQRLFLLNTPTGRRAIEQLRDGRIDLGRPVPVQQGAAAMPRDNLFLIYEENIGPLTPLVAQELKEAEELYPFEWLEEALREAALQNKRSWRYAAAILQRWATEGRRRETVGRDPGEGDSARAQLLRRYRELGRQ